MSLLSCSLGCVSGGECAINDVYVNQEIWLEFSQPVNMATVTKSTFQVVNSLTGEAPPGTFIQDPTNARRVAFRPMVSFDSSGNATFGMQPGGSYRITVPGSGMSGAKIASTGGQPNTSSVDCFVQATLGVNDVVPGQPTVIALLDIPGGSEPVVADAAEDVPFEATLRFVFDDVMNPATLVHPVLFTSDTMRVTVDLDGDANTKADRVPLEGAFQIQIDLDQKRTIVTFAPKGGFPSSGTLGVTRRIVVELPNAITDIAGNPLLNAGEVIFTTIAVAFPPTILPKGSGEDFADLTAIDMRRSGALFDPPTGGSSSGRARPGLGGGSGRFGDLVLLPGVTFTLGLGANGSTFGPNATTNPAAGDLRTWVIDNYDENTPPGTQDITAEDSIYEFSYLEVRPGAILRFAGDVPPRIHVRGATRIDGVIDLRGQTQSALHDSLEAVGQLGAPGGPGGGPGGKGGDRLNTAGTPLSAANHAVNQPGLVSVLDGQAGQGRNGMPNAGGGTGGLRNPLNYPGPGASDHNGFLPTGPSTSNPDNQSTACASYQVGNPGGGGTFGSFGTPSVWTYGGIPTTWLPPAPTPTPPGPEQLRASETTLDPNQGLLVGGAGGGGGGAIHLQVGGEAQVNGSIDLRGGGGGAGEVVGGPARYHAAPGGGGSGGALLLQAGVPALATGGGVVDVRGGEGGFTQWTGSRGGDGGAGVVRLEVPADALISPETEAAKVLPQSGGPGQPPLGDIVHVATWTPTTTGAGAYSGFQSCWLTPQGAIFDVAYADDDAAGPGWDLDIELTGGTVVPFRTLSSFAGGSATPEQVWGNDLGSSPIVVRFQGARIVTQLANPCIDTSNESGSGFLLGSTSAWLRHPTELNTFWETALPDEPETAAQRKPNTMRYQVVFDRSHPQSASIVAIRGLRVRAQPD